MRPADRAPIVCTHGIPHSPSDSHSLAPFPFSFSPPPDLLDSCFLSLSLSFTLLSVFPLSPYSSPHPTLFHPSPLLPPCFPLLFSHSLSPSLSLTHLSLFISSFPSFLSLSPRVSSPRSSALQAVFLPRFTHHLSASHPIVLFSLSSPSRLFTPFISLFSVSPFIPPLFTHFLFFLLVQFLSLILLPLPFPSSFTPSSSVHLHLPHSTSTFPFPLPHSPSPSPPSFHLPL